MQIEVKSGTTIYVAHDRRLPTPQWLSSQFQLTDLTFNINGRPMSVFKYSTQQQESLTLSSNTSGPHKRAQDMYVVFVKESKSQ